MAQTIDDLLVGGGAAGKGLKFENIGDGYSGKVVSAEVRAYTNIQTGKPEFWDDGNPKQQIVIGIQTDQRDPSIENDDGVRYDYIKGWGEQKKAFRKAAQDAGGSPAVGDTYSVKYVNSIPSETRGFSPTKIYEYAFKKGNPLDSLVGAPVPDNAATLVSGPSDAARAQIAKLIELGLADDKIAQAVDGITVADVEQVRLQAAASGSKGF